MRRWSFAASSLTASFASRITSPPATVTASAPKAVMSLHNTVSPPAVFLSLSATTLRERGSTTRSATRPTVLAVLVLTTSRPVTCVNSISLNP